MDNQEKITQYRFTAYLMKSIANHKARYGKKKKRLLDAEELFGDFNDLLPEHQAQYIENDIYSEGIQNAALEKAIAKLKGRDAKILLLHLLEDYSLKEIAALLNIKYNSVLSIYARALKKVKDEMGDNNNEF